MDTVELFQGERFRVVAVRADRDERSHVEGYLLGQPKQLRRKLARAITHFASHGPNFNPEKCRRLKGRASELMEIKEKPARLLGFYCPVNRGVLVLTHGFDKRTETTPEAEIERALNLRDQYLRSLRGE